MNFKFLFVYSILTTIVYNSFAQQKLPKFGEVNKADLEMKECSFDKSAGAMVLFDEAEAVFDLNFNLPRNPVFEKTTRRTRIKIFSKKEFDRANIKINYPNANDVSIRKFNAQTYNLDENGNLVITKVDKASTYDKELSKRNKQFIFTFPNVKEGSILEFEYVLDGHTLDKWYFQRSIPSAYSKYTIAMEKGLDVATIKHCTLPVEKGNDPNMLENYSWYIMKNIPAFKEEPYMSCDEDYLQRMEVRLTGINIAGTPYTSFLKTWATIVKDVINDEDFGKQLNKDIPRTMELDNLLIGVTDTLQKIKIIHDYVRTNMKWNEEESIWALTGVKNAWKNKEGTSGEINLILINLLRDANINVKPILVSTVENGIVNISYPSLSYFNKVMAYIEVGGKQYVLDATENNTPTHLIPLSVMASEGLVIEKSDKYAWNWKTIWSAQNKFSRNIIINANCNDKSIFGSASVLSSGYDKMNQLKLLNNNIGSLNKSFETNEITIDSLEVLNTKKDESVLIQNFNFIAPINTTSSFTSFSINYFTGLQKNPFLAEERKTDIFFGAQQEYSISLTVQLPKGAVMEEVPKNSHLVTPDNAISIKRISTLTNNELKVQLNISLLNPLYSVEAYPDLKEFYKMMYDLLDEKYVYKL